MYKLIRPILFKTDPEHTHTKVLELGKYLSKSHFKKIFESFYNFEDERLNINVFGIDFKNPIGLAAGFDKNGELIDFLPYLGFGFVEIGSITAQKRDGNPKPRLFRLPKDKAIINRMGLNNQGADNISKRLIDKYFKIPIGINISKTNDPLISGKKSIEDFCYSFEKLYEVGKFTTINISCPNTKEGKTFEDKYALNELLSALKEKEKKYLNKKPLLIKISTDLSYETLDDILDISEQHNIDGYVISNTSSKRIKLKTSSKTIKNIGKGGLSGKPIKEKSNELIKYVKRQLNTSIIGVGGIFSAEDAYEKIKAGASLVQVYTGMIYEGPGLIKKINKGLIKLLEKSGFSSLKDAIEINNKLEINSKKGGKNEIRKNSTNRICSIIRSNRLL